MASSTREYLDVLAAQRGEAIVVTTMSAAKTWPLVSDGPLDLNYLPSAMSHAGDIALGLALARPERPVVCVNGDGSLLMNLGSLVTAADSAASNYLMLLLENGTYDVVGGAGVPGAGAVDFAGLAAAAGWPIARRIEDAGALADALPELLSGRGPAFAALIVSDPPQPEFQLPAHHPKTALRTLRSHF